MHAGHILQKTCFCASTVLHLRPGGRVTPTSALLSPLSASNSRDTGEPTAFRPDRELGAPYVAWVSTLAGVPLK